jgi:hypothetical protein
MRQWLYCACTCVGLVWSSWLQAGGGVSAQVTPPICVSVRGVPVIQPTGLTELVGGISLPLRTCDGVPIGSAKVLSFVDPSLTIRPTFFELTVLGERIIATEVVSQRSDCQRC